MFVYMYACILPNTVIFKHKYLNINSLILAKSLRFGIPPLKVGDRRSAGGM